MTFGGNNFNDFPENQLTTFLCKPTWVTLLYHLPLVLISDGGTVFPKNIWGNGVPPKNIWWNGIPPRLHHWCQAMFNTLNVPVLNSFWAHFMLLPTTLKTHRILN